MSDDDTSAGFGQYCPITRAMEVLGERWSVMIIRDMLCGFDRFNDLARGQPGLSRSLLSKRLRQLQRAGIVARVEDRYVLTNAGQELRPIVFAIGEWGARWQFDDPRSNEMDPQLLMWWVHRRLDFSVLPERRWVFEFRFSDVSDRFWILKDSLGPSVCTYDPGFGIDAVISSDLSTMYRVWLGKVGLGDALRARTVEFHGAPTVVRRLSSVLELSPVAALVAETPVG